MPPRERRRGSRRVGLKRIDAAVDALLPLGFSKELVRKTVNNLLKVYDGDEGWVFIEEASYKLLIETILEEQEMKGKHVIEEHPNLEEDACEEGGTALKASEPMEGTSWVRETSSCRDSLGDTKGEHGAMTNEYCESTSKINEVGRRNVDIGAASNMTYAGCRLEQSNQPTIANGQGLHNEPVHNFIAGEGSGQRRESCGTGRSREPCFGWISEDEEDEEENARATVSDEQQMVQCAVSHHGERKRKSRWDVMLSDML